jgi:MIP family channel proteins
MPEQPGRALLAEFLGTFALVFFAAGSAALAATTHPFGLTGAALAAGLAVAAVIYAIGHISGAHINPAVTLAFAVARHFPASRVIGYWAAQFAGAIAAAAVLRAGLGTGGYLGGNQPTGSEGRAFAWEIVLTAILMFVVMAVATDTRAIGEAAAIAIGATVIVDVLVGGPVSGGSMNPARSLGPALLSGQPTALWIYLVGPPVGAAIGAFAYQLVRGEGARPASSP